MSRRRYEYGDDFVAVKRPNYAGSEADTDYLADLRRSYRSRAESANFTPQGSSYDEQQAPSEELAYFSMNHHQFESSFCGTRGRERAPLAPRLFDMRNREEDEGLNQKTDEEEVEGDGVYQPSSAYDTEVEMRQLAPEQQELAIIEDVLSLLMGVSGRYISFSHHATSNVWRLPMSVETALSAPRWLNPTLTKMTNKILPLVLLHKRVEYFTIIYSNRRAGVVNQALCAAIRSILKKFYAQLATLENMSRISTATNPYTLQQLWYHLYPELQTFERIVHLISAIQAKDTTGSKRAIGADKNSGKQRIGGNILGTVPDTRNILDSSSDDDDGDERDGGVQKNKIMSRSDFGEGHSNEANEEAGDDSDTDSEIDIEVFDVRGGRTLNIISDMIRLRGGDISAKRLYEYLLEKSSAPFMSMLRHWLQTGELDDKKLGGSGGEFMVTSDSEALTARTFVDLNALDEDIPEMPATKRRRLGFVSVPELTPEFFAPYTTKIVRTGEYLNILKSCGVDMRAPDKQNQQQQDLTEDKMSLISDTEAVGSLCSLDPLEKLVGADKRNTTGDLFSPQVLMHEIDQSYLRANQALIDVLFKEKKLMGYMGAVKRYLLFEKSDFLTHFLDLAKSEMARSPADVSVTRLQSFLDLALLNPGSVSHDDPLKDIVKVSVEPIALVDTMKSITMGGDGSMGSSLSVTTPRRLAVVSGQRSQIPGEAGSSGLTSNNALTSDLFVALKLQIPFPFTIVLDRVALNKYKALSRLLLALKQTEQNLVSSWLVNLKFGYPPTNPTGASSSESGITGMEAKVAMERHKVYLLINALRHRILVSIQQILFYCVWEVIEPNWKIMIKEMKKATTVDELCGIHTKYVDLMIQQCGLTASKLPKTIIDLLLLANEFIARVSRLVSSNQALFSAVGPGSSSKNTVSGRLLAEMRRGTTDLDTQLSKLNAANKQVEDLDRKWNGQLKILIHALNHYRSKFEHSYSILAQLLDSKRQSMAHI